MMIKMVDIGRVGRFTNLAGRVGLVHGVPEIAMGRFGSRCTDPTRED